MASMATDGRATGYFAPGDIITDDRGMGHSVWKVLHTTGAGPAGVLLTVRTTVERYSVWLISTTGDVRATVTMGDVTAALGMFEARVIEALRNGREGKE